MAVTKQQLTARTRGKGGTVVIHRGQRLVVKDLFDRKTYNVPDRVGVGPTDRGIAWGANLDELELG